MKKLLQKNLSFILFFCLLSSFAQKGNYDLEPEIPFQPMFTLGSSYHAFQGDIMGPKTNTLLGNIGYSAGMRLNMTENIDLSLLFSNGKFHEGNDSSTFTSNFNTVGLHLDYILNVFNRSRLNPFITAGIQTLSFKTYNQKKYDRETSIVIPVGIGLALDVSERIQMNAGLNYGLSMADIDKDISNSSDNFLTASFSISYDLFTPKSDSKIVHDDSYYADVNFQKLDLEDTDGDRVPDIDDYCPKTPKGVRVNEMGCPIDTDNDGIADYIDKENNTRKGAVVDEYGVQLTDDKYYSMYSKYEAASREYANFYNESEIQREDFTTTNDYLIAKANAFNKSYNSNGFFDNKVIDKQYKIELGRYKESVDAALINRFLSFDDLESIPQEDGVIVYALGSYENIEDALGRQYELEAKDFDDTRIIIDNNGVLSSYIESINEEKSQENIQEEAQEQNQEEVQQKTEGELETVREEVLEDKTESVDDNLKLDNIEKTGTVYRIQIGAYKILLNQKVFDGVDNVISYKGTDGLIRYTTGSFSDYSTAVNYMNQMRARGFEDAFIVTYKDGKRINLNIAISEQKSQKKKNQKKFVSDSKLESEKDRSTEYLIQIGVFQNNLSADILSKMAKVGSITKEKVGSDLYKYFAGIYTNIEDAEIRLSSVKKAGFGDAFILAVKNGERVDIR